MKTINVTQGLLDANPFLVGKAEVGQTVEDGWCDEDGNPIEIVIPEGTEFTTSGDDEDSAPDDGYVGGHPPGGPGGKPK